MRSARVCAAVLVTVVPAMLWAQEPLVIEAETAVVALQVTVTGRDGKPVLGLTAEDFEVKDGGKLRPVVAVHEIDALEPPPPLEDAPWALQAVAQRQFVLLFDLSFTSVPGLMRSRRSAAEFVEKGVGPNDLVAIGTISVEGGVKLLVNLTSDRKQALRAIAELGTGHIQRGLDPLRLALEIGGELAGASREELSGQVDGLFGGDIEDRVREFVRDQVVQYRRSATEQYARNVSAYLAALSSLGGALDAVSGRKEVILLSAGFDQTPLLGAQGEEAFQVSRSVTEGRLWEVESDSHFGSAEARDALRDAVRNFAATGAVVHALDVSGLVADVDASSALGDSRKGAGRETLAQIASSGGGRLIQNTNDLTGGLGEILDATRHFYAIAFEPEPSGEPGRYRKLDVEVKRSGTRVSHRKGYVVPDPAVERHPLTRQLRAAEAIVKGLSGGSLRFDAAAFPYRNPAGTLTLPVTLELYPDDLFAGLDADVAELEVFGYAVAESGTIEDALAFRGALDRAALGDGAPVQVRTTFRTQPGPHSLRFVMRELASGKLGAQTVSLDVPAFERGGLVLYPPLVMKTTEERHVLTRPSLVLPASGQPFRTGVGEFAPDLRPELVNGQPIRVCVMFWSGQASYAAGAEFEVSLELAGVADPPPLSLELVDASEEADGFRRYVIAATPAGVPAGEYELRVAVTDPATGSSAKGSRRVLVR
jgi:VWFA-related protein